MKKPDLIPLPGTSILHGIVFLLLGSTTLVITINSFDSGIAKTPLLVLLAGLLVVSYVSMAIWAGELIYRPSPVDIPVLMFLLLMIASAGYSGVQGHSARALELWIPYIILLFAGTHLFSNQDAVKKLRWILALIASAVALVALIQYFFSGELALDFFIGTDRRVTSTLTNSTYLSGYIVLLFPFLLTSITAKPRQAWFRWLILSLLCGLAFVLFVTSTRSSIAAFVVSLLALVFLSKQASGRAIALGASALLAVILALYVTPHLVERVESSFRNDPSSTFARRTYFWKAGYNAWKAAPLFGHGIGSYEDIMLEYRSPDYWVVKSEDLVPHAHNEVIETAVDLGGIGAATYLWIWGLIFFHSLKGRRDEKRQERFVRVGLCCSVLAIFIDNLTNLSLRVAPVGATAWLLMGVLMSQVSGDAPAKVTRLQATRWLILLPLGGWVIFALMYVGQQRPRFAADRHLIKASLANEARNIPEAASEYRQAATVDPDNLLARSNLALLLLETGNPSEALETVTQLQKLSPDYPKSSLVQAAALVSLKRYPEALQRIDKELTLRDHPEAYYYQAAANMGMGDSAAERQSLEHLALADIKGNLDFELGPVSRRLKAITTKKDDLMRLREVYKQLSEAFPSDTTVTSVLAWLNGKLAPPTHESGTPHE